jgi:hypothetical protein
MLPQHGMACTWVQATGAEPGLDNPTTGVASDVGASLAPRASQGLGRSSVPRAPGRGPSLSARRFSGQGRRLWGDNRQGSGLRVGQPPHQGAPGDRTGRRQSVRRRVEDTGALRATAKAVQTRHKSPLLCL